jgi:carboxypeptidase D
MALNYYNNVINLNETFLKDINERYQTCGYYDFMEKALTFPPTGKLPNAPSSTQPGCTMWEDIVTAALYTNPCFNYYHLTDFCPFPWSIMGLYPSGGPNNYWNRSDVQAVIHAPPTNYLFCGEWPPFPNGQPSPETPFGDTSLPSSLGPLPSVIERTNNVVINNGMLDFVIFANGTLVSIQNMTWNGAQGFQKAPSNSLFVPYHPGLAENAAAQLASAGSWTTQVFIQDAGSGYLGLTHTERGLTFNTVLGSGHREFPTLTQSDLSFGCRVSLTDDLEIPMYAPGAAYRVFEFLLGRIGNLTDQGDFTTLPGNFTG